MSKEKLKNNNIVQEMYDVYQEYDLDPLHSQQVRKIALNIFEQMKKFFNFTEDEEYILETSALLHDLGISKSFSKHHKHSYKIIMNGASKIKEKKYLYLIACIARYHRKAEPKLKHKMFAQLNKAERNTVKKLAAILRIADGLDRSHNAVVRNVNINLKNEGIFFEVYITVSYELEKFGFEKKKHLFEKVYKKPLFIKFIINQ